MGEFGTPDQFMYIGLNENGHVIVEVTHQLHAHKEVCERSRFGGGSNCL
jgi:hypothetical protein